MVEVVVADVEGCASDGDGSGAPADSAAGFAGRRAGRELL
jgi:hypothetical protein